MQVSVNTTVDLSVGVLTHFQLSPPLIPAPVPVPAVELPVVQKWLPGYAMGKNKLTTTVKHSGLPIAQFQHDCGLLIPDITFPPVPNIWYVVMWPLSSRKIMFPASTVLMDKKPTGCAQTFGLPVLPMMTCGDPISAPTALALTPQLNSVKVGMTWKDLLHGITLIAVSMAIDFVFEYGFRVSGFKQWGKAFTRTADEVAEEAMSKMAKDIGEATAQRLSRAMAGEIAERRGRELAESYLNKYARRQVRKELFKKHVFPVYNKGDYKELGKKALKDLSGFAVSDAYTGIPTGEIGIGGPFVEVKLERTADKGWVEKGRILGWERDTTGGGMNWGEPLP